MWLHFFFFTILFERNDFTDNEKAVHVLFSLEADSFSLKNSLLVYTCEMIYEYSCTYCLVLFPLHRISL